MQCAVAALMLKNTSNAAQLAVRATLNGSGMSKVRGSAGVVCALF
jgi:hypothetical protein